MVENQNVPEGPNAWIYSPEDIIESFIIALVGKLYDNVEVIRSPEALVEDVKCNAHGSEFVNYEQLASSIQPTCGVWALNNTGALHHMFNNIKLFDTSTIQKINGTNKQLILARGGISLAVHLSGSIQLKAGDGSEFRLGECLYVPELS
ncbi:hypothetical protein CROQUDRAFT_99732 [Cronartium quercuum f. sp. fusiforme G11]|uniref:Retrovirus-related Pol polyprotein from transposon TNT 1-94-like beta-barrel domain-containing protein n=1 Tax=Cronartium quercuum f. sp. fusiforme G11 TaxID=708437 RepID=A0A9P6T7Q9_9BASI|nr:hypothetical protein CROQUDRAFT_99732 [Cronartium quercuum f. sp. fusiforme G11]